MTGYARIARWAAVAAAIMVGLASPAAAAGADDLFKGFSGKSKDPIHVDAEALEIEEQGDTRISVFSGGVTVTRGDTTLKAATIKLYSDKKSSATNKNGFTRIEATGTVYVNSKDQTVTGKTAVVDNKAQTITLSGDVVLTQGDNIITGDRLIIDMETGKARVEQTPGKRIQGVFSADDAKKLGKDKPDEKTPDKSADKAADKAAPKSKPPAKPTQ